tara:strand:- start:19 stop:444 length:426 start_codon:yes stop_codon:yes gene_type:complete
MSLQRTKSLKSDIEYGNRAEIEVIKALRVHFGENIIKNTFRFATYDANCKETNTNYEIKARRCKVDSYPTTIIPYSKIVKKQEKDKLIFVFLFTDGLYYIKYDRKVFEPFGMDEITYYRQGIEPKPVKHTCIPIELLVKIS